MGIGAAGGALSVGVATGTAITGAGTMVIELGLALVIRQDESARGMTLAATSISDLAMPIVLPLLQTAEEVLPALWVIELRERLPVKPTTSSQTRMAMFTARTRMAAGSSGRVASGRTRTRPLASNSVRPRPTVPARPIDSGVKRRVSNPLPVRVAAI